MEEDHENPVLLKQFSNEPEAELLVDNLIFHGVFAFIQKDDPASMGIVRGAKVFVRKSDLKKAMEVLKALGD